MPTRPMSGSALRTSSWECERLPCSTRSSGRSSQLPAPLAGDEEPEYSRRLKAAHVPGFQRWFAQQESRLERALESQVGTRPELHSQPRLRCRYALRLQQEARAQVHRHERLLVEVAAKFHLGAHQEIVELPGVAGYRLDRHVCRCDVEHVCAEPAAGAGLELVEQQLVEEHVHGERRQALRYHLARRSHQTL